jgi:hypothetical protein
MRIGCNSKINSRQFNQNLKCAYEWGLAIRRIMTYTLNGSSFQT